MAGTARVVKRVWPLFTLHGAASAYKPFEQAVFDSIVNIITDLETLRAAHDARHVLLDADTGVTDTDYEGGTNGLTIDTASDLLAFTISTPELGD